MGSPTHSIQTDSDYAVRIIHNKAVPTANLDLWDLINAAITSNLIDRSAITWVRAHSGLCGNEAADIAANFVIDSAIIQPNVEDVPRAAPATKSHLQNIPLAKPVPKPRGTVAPVAVIQPLRIEKHQAATFANELSALIDWQPHPAVQMASQLSELLDDNRGLENESASSAYHSRVEYDPFEHSSYRESPTKKIKFDHASSIWDPNYDMNE
jgi:hypothetical protein